MIDPNDAACSPATCLRAEAEDLMERATAFEGVALTLSGDEMIQFRASAQAHRDLAARYQRAADELDAIEDGKFWATSPCRASAHVGSDDGSASGSLRPIREALAHYDGLSGFEDKASGPLKD